MKQGMNRARKKRKKKRIKPSVGRLRPATRGSTEPPTSTPCVDTEAPIPPEILEVNPPEAPISEEEKRRTSSREE